MNFAQVLRDARQLGGLTQSQLSTRSGITQSVISAYERGRREPGAETFLMLIEAAGLDFIIRVPTNTYRHPTLPDSAQTRALVKHRQQIPDLGDPKSLKPHVQPSVAKDQLSL